MSHGQSNVHIEFISDHVTEWRSVAAGAFCADGSDNVWPVPRQAVTTVTGPAHLNTILPRNLLPNCSQIFEQDRDRPPPALHPD
jgi:hypothetical protein